MTDTRPYPTRQEIIDADAELHRLRRELAAARQERDRLREAAQAFIDTMGFRYSGASERKVPQGFTRDSNRAAIALFDALAATTAAGDEQ